MNKPFFSIIVPVYNGMPFVNKCLENLCGQTFTDIEIILIDDGSTDGSDDVCKHYQSIDDRISFLSNGHHGVSNARNCGLQIAKGDWILFMDCDDVYDINTLNILKNIIDQNPDVDLVSGIFSRINIHNEQTAIFPHPKNGLFSFYEYVQNGSFYPSGVCGHAIKLSIIIENGLTFNENLTIVEDGLFMVYYCAFINYVYLSNDIVYQYRVNPHSTMRTKRTVEKIESQLSSAALMYDASKSGNEDYRRLTILRAKKTLAITILNVAQSRYSISELISLYKSISAKSNYMGYLSKRRIICRYIIYKLKVETKRILHIRESS